ncbi:MULTISPECIES: ABC transporter substrate-binding protein [Streptomyces]|uniref:Extracellular solute-binding protein n=1 Tax=Streptomyces koelreuteriae TaxID=2838015 RepID=A0ABX8G1T8_9ACTN|nr:MULTISPECIES: extracellular solute-binding protein [Streptomyces]QWB27202.1 extracellular solute-binding protein [Streptomyces koelreuteriae]UUA10285.1 extracellular solute-binding protein [Streptomyces koelreuteriae]UUA17892.1 extracellular solute-binding protein [Streptomyces sp. CRCS-T-1]
MTITARTRRIAVVAALALATGTLSGCGSSSDDEGDSLTYWSMWNQNEPQAKVIKAASDQFTKDTGIKVNIQWQGRQVIQKITPTLRSGAAADLVDNSVNALGTLVSAGQNADLSPVYTATIPGENKTVAEVIPEKYKAYLNDKNGKPFMVPYSVATEGVWFDAAKYPELAANPPKTWEDLVEKLDGIKATGVAPIALPSNDPYWTLLTLQRQLGTEGVRELAADKSGAAWDDPEVRAAVKKVEHLRDHHFIKGYESTQGTQAQTSWAQGKAAFYLNGTWVPGESKPNVDADFKYGNFQLPAIDGGNTAVGVNFFGFAVPKTAKNSAEAQKFIAYFMNKKHLTGIATQALNIAPRPDVPAPEELAAVAKALDGNDVYADQARLFVDYAAWATKAYTPNVVRFIQGVTSADEFIDQTRRASVDFWKANP